MEAHQAEDEFLHELINKLKRGEDHPNLSLNKGVLCHQDRAGKKMIYLPANLIPMVFNFSHSSVAGGHLGVRKTTRKIGELFFWENWKNYVRQKVQDCKLCGLSKPAQDTHLGLLASDVAENVLGKLFIDFVGPYPRSK